MERLGCSRALWTERALLPLVVEETGGGPHRAFPTCFGANPSRVARTPISQTLARPPTLSRPHKGGGDANRTASGASLRHEAVAAVALDPGAERCGVGLGKAGRAHPVDRFAALGGRLVDAER